MGRIQGYNTPEAPNATLKIYCSLHHMLTLAAWQPTGLDFETGVKSDIAWVSLRWDAPRATTEQWTTTENGDYSSSLVTLPVNSVLENSVWWR